MGNTSYDAIIIGSGVGGMAAAVHLSNQNKKVLLLEAAKHFGGFTNPFKRKAYHFDPGIHYLGELAEGQIFREILEKLKLWDKIEFNKIGEDHFDRYVFPEFEFKVPADRKIFKERLLTMFPEEEKGIKIFLQILELLKDIHSDSNKQRTVFSDIKSIDNSEVLGKIRSITYAELMAHLFSNENIKAVLSGLCGDLGLAPAKIAAMSILGLFNHYLDGAYYPKGGSAAFRDAFINTIKENNSDLKTSSKVKKIIVENERAVGVITEAGEEYRAKVIISNADPVHTFTKLLEETDVSKKVFKKACNIKNSLGAVCLFIGTDVPDENIKLGSENIWHYPSTDIDKTYSQVSNPNLFLDDNIDLSFFLSCPTHKDPHSSKAPKGHNTLELVVFAPYAPFAKWDKNRDEEYKELKNKIQKKFVGLIEKYYVKDLSKHIVVCEVSTPLTNIDYINTPDGSIYGPEHSPKQTGFGRFLPRGYVKGLYLCGAGVFSAGISPSCISGYLAANLAMKELGT